MNSYGCIVVIAECIQRFRGITEPFTIGSCVDLRPLNSDNGLRKIIHSGPLRRGYPNNVHTKPPTERKI